MTQAAEIPPSIYIYSSNLSVVNNFKYLGSTISSNLSLDVEINVRDGKQPQYSPTKWFAEQQSDHEYQTQSLSGIV